MSMELWFADSFLTWVAVFQKMSSWLKNDPSARIYFMILVGSLVYGFIGFRFFKAYLEHIRALKGLSATVEVEKQRTEQLKIAARK